MACFRAGSAPGEVMNIKQEEPLPIKQEPEDDVSDQDEEDDTRMHLEDSRTGMDDSRMGMDDSRMGMDDSRMGMDDSRGGSTASACSTEGSGAHVSRYQWFGLFLSRPGQFSMSKQRLPVCDQVIPVRKA